MAAPSAHNLTVELSKSDHGGSAWIVRVYRKGIFRKKLVSSDWFLDERQARDFARRLERELGSLSAVDHVRRRPPGWTLHRPAH